MACSVTVKNGTLEQSEINAYIARATKKYGVEPQHIDINVCGDEVARRGEGSREAQHWLKTRSAFSQNACQAEKKRV